MHVSNSAALAALFVAAVAAAPAGAQDFRRPPTGDPYVDQRDGEERLTREEWRRRGGWRDDWRGRGDGRGRSGGDEDGSTKICSILVPGNWRDTFPVPDSWSARNCRDYAVAVGATDAQIGCIFSSGRSAFSLDSWTAQPNPDCGWGDERRGR